MRKRSIDNRRKVTNWMKSDSADKPKEKTVVNNAYIRFYKGGALQWQRARDSRFILCREKDKR